MEIFAEQIIYKPRDIFMIICIIIGTIGAISLFLSLETYELKFLMVSGICLAIIIVIFILCGTQENLIFKEPIRKEYTVEITDDTLWKDIVHEYTIKERVYPDQEIYIITKDYVEEN